MPASLATESTSNRFGAADYRWGERASTGVVEGRLKSMWHFTKKRLGVGSKRADDVHGELSVHQRPAFEGAMGFWERTWQERGEAIKLARNITP
jgi:hypothetical protein